MGAVSASPYYKDIAKNLKPKCSVKIHKVTRKTNAILMHFFLLLFID